MLNTSRQLIISKERLLDEAFELGALLLSHQSYCIWLGPYDIDSIDDDVIPKKYGQYFEEKVSSLIYSLTIKIRCLDYRGELTESLKKTEPENAGLGHFGNDSEWKAIDDFRRVLDLIVHAVRVVPDESVKPVVVGLPEDGLQRDSISHGINFLFEGDGKGVGKNQAKFMRLNLQAFCDMVFRLYEQFDGKQ